MLKEFKGNNWNKTTVHLIKKIQEMDRRKENVKVAEEIRSSIE